MPVDDKKLVTVFGGARPSTQLKRKGEGKVRTEDISIWHATFPGDVLLLLAP